MFSSQKQSLKKEIESLREQLLKLQMDHDRIAERKRTVEQEMQHMLKMMQEKMEIDLEKKTAKIQSEADEKVAKVKDEYRDKIEAMLQKEGDTIRGMYTEILARLPNINAKLTGDI